MIVEKFLSLFYWMMSKSPFRKTPRKYVLSDWNKRDEKLMLAVEKGQPERVQHLVTKKQISPFKIDPKRQITAFHQAALDGNVGLVELMLRDGNGTVNTKDLFGRTALHCAVQKARHDVTQKLIESGADLLMVDHESWSVLHHACVGGHLGCIQLLLAKTAPVYLKDKNGVGPLCLAATRGQATVCRLLLENGADVNDTDNQNRTPLMMAAEHGHTALCEYLLTKGAVVELADKEGHDALWFAVKNKHRDVVKVLQKRGVHQPPLEDTAAGTSGRTARVKVVEDWPFHVGLQDDAYEPVQALNGRPSTPSKAPPPSSSTPTGSMASRERMPSPTTESPIEGTGNGEETHKEEEEKEEEGEGLSHYSQIQERDSTKPPGDGKKIELSGESFRSFVDAAFGLRAGMTSSEGVAARTTDEAEVLRTSLEDRKEDESVDVVVETQRRQSFEEEDSTVLIRSFMTDSSDVISGESKVTTYDGPELEITLSDDVTGSVDDVKENIESVIRGVVVGPEGRRETAAKVQRSVEEEEEARTKQFIVDVHVVTPTETDFGCELTAAAAKRDEDQVTAEVTAAASPVQEDLAKTVGGLQLPVAVAKEEEEREESVPADWPSSLSRLITSEDDLRELFQHISELERENASLRRQLESMLSEHSDLEASKRETDKKLSLALNRQQWIHQELILMRRFLDEMRDRISGQTDLDQRLRRAEVDMETLDRHLAALINLEVGAIDDVEIYSSVQDLRKGTNGTDRSVEPSVVAARLERENKALLFQLRQAIEENKQLQSQMEEVEKFVSIARELKEENEALIADYKRFRDVQEEEVSEMDELAELFKDTLEENKALQAQNEELRVKVLELQGLLDAVEARNQMNRVDETERLEMENRRLKAEVAELTDAVNRQSQTILDMDERLRAVNSHAIHPPSDGRILETFKLDRTDEGVAPDEEKRRLREMYDELKAQTVLILKELEEKRETQTRIAEEFEERGTEIVHLRSALDRKGSEIRRLTEEADELNRQLELAFDEFRKDQERAKKDLRRLQEENIQLKAFIEEVGKVEDEPEKRQSSRIEEVSKPRPNGITADDEIGQTGRQGRKELAEEPNAVQPQVDAAAATAVTTASVETQVDYGDLPVEEDGEDGEWNGDGTETIVADLQKAVDLTRKLMAENRLLKRQMKMLSEENQRYRNSQLSDAHWGPGREKELEELRALNKELLTEVQGLKRTINEQSMYLLQIGHDSNLLISTAFPSEPDDREESEKQQQQHQGGRTSMGDDQTDDCQMMSLGDELIPEDKKRFRFKHRSLGRIAEFENGLETSVELASESEGEAVEELVENGSAGKSYHRPAANETKRPAPKMISKLLVAVPNGRKDGVADERKQVAMERKEVQVDIVKEAEARGNGLRPGQVKQTAEIQRVHADEQVALLQQEISTKDGKIKELEETAEELLNEVDRRNELEEECEKIVQGYKAVLSEFSKCKGLIDIESRGDGTPFGELKVWLNNYKKSELESTRLAEEKRTLQDELESAKERLRELEEERTMEKTRLDQIKNDLDKEVKELRQKFDLKDTEVAKIRERFEDLTSSNVKLEKELDKLRQDLASKTEELTTLVVTSRRQEESLRADNETLRSLLESKSPQMDSDYEEHLLSEIERLTDAKEDLEKQLKEKDYQLEEVRDELLEHLDLLKMKLEAEQNRAERECAEILDDQEELIEENKKLQAKVTAFERDLRDAQELYEEEKIASEKNRELLEEELQRLRADRKTKADEEADLMVLCNTLTHRLEALEEEMKKASLEKNQALSQCRTFQQNHAQLEKTHKDLTDKTNQLQKEKESLSKTLERETTAVDEINRRLTERLDLLRLENEKLIKENEKLALILEMEKLKNFVGEDQTTLTSDSVRQLTKTESERLFSKKTEDRSDVCLQTELQPESPPAEGVEVENEIQSFRSSNRKLALEVAELHCRLSQKLLPLPDEDGEGVAAAREKREPVQQILRDLAKENLRHLQVMAETEEQCDRLKQELRRMRAEFNHPEQENKTLKELSSLHPGSWNELLEALRQENTKLKEFVAVLEDLMAQKSSSASPIVASSASSVEPQRTTDAGASRDETLHLGDSHDSGISPNHLHQRSDDSAVARVFQLQRMLQENDQKYRDIICTYRRHLLCSVQGTIDPEVKAALLRIIDIRCGDTDL